MKPITQFGFVGLAGAVVAFLALTPAVYGHGEKHNPTRAEYLAEVGIPSEYVDLLNPLPATAEALDAGNVLYADNCAACHGDQGDGKGAVATDLNPPPAGLKGMYDPAMIGMDTDEPDGHLMHGVAHHHPGQTHAEAMGGLNLDAYMFWALSEGGEELETSMPGFNEILTEEERWQILLYIANDFSPELM